MKNKEQWKTITIDDGMFSRYQVSNQGRVRNSKTGRILINQICNPQGHMQVCFSVKGKLYFRLVHRLVAFEFCDNPSNHDYVLHWDGLAHNNHSSNLRWGTAKDNKNDSIRHGRSGLPYQIRTALRTMRSNGVPIKVIADLTGSTYGQVRYYTQGVLSNYQPDMSVLELAS